MQLWLETPWTISKLWHVTTSCSSPSSLISSQKIKTKSDLYQKELLRTIETPAAAHRAILGLAGLRSTICKMNLFHHFYEYTVYSDACREFLCRSSQSSLEPALSNIVLLCFCFISSYHHNCLVMKLWCLSKLGKCYFLTLLCLVIIDKRRWIQFWLIILHYKRLCK